MVVRHLPQQYRWQHGKGRMLARILRNDRLRRSLSDIRARILSIDHPHRADKSVPFPNNSFHKAWFSGIVTQSTPNFSHNIVEVPVGIDKQIRAPELPDDVLA